MALLDDVKAHLRVDGNESDELLKRLIASATSECMAYMEIDEGDYRLEKPDVITGIVLAVQADYDGDPAKRSAYIAAARSLWDLHAPYAGV